MPRIIRTLRRGIRHGLTRWRKRTDTHFPLPEVRAAPANAAEIPHLFAVISWGCAGTSWLAKSLNSHAEILCLHAWKSHVAPFAAQSDASTDLREMHALQSAGSDYLCVGDVHGVHRESIPALAEYFQHVGFSAAGITRNPLRRLRSQMSLFARHNFDHRLWGDMSYLRARPGYADVADAIESSAQLVCFAHGANMLNNIVEEVRCIPRIFRMEDLTGNVDDFAEFIAYISGGRIRPAADVAQRMMSLKPVNQHSRRSHRRPNFSEAEIRILQALVTPAAWDLYEGFGYERPEWIPDCQTAAA